MLLVYSDIVYTAPGLKRKIYVWTEARKTKMKKNYLLIYLREVFGMFKTKKKDCEIGFFLFASLRPRYLLDQCKCWVHENSYLFPNGLAVNIDKIQFCQIVLCDSEHYKSSCWKRECGNCCNGNVIPFTNMIRSRIISYEKWGYNDQKRLTLKTLECPFGEIKDKFCEQFLQFQKQVRIKRIMCNNLEQNKKDSKCHFLGHSYIIFHSM